MGYGLLSKHGAVHFCCEDWEATLQLATTHGWKPMGTAPPAWKHQRGEKIGSPLDWDGD
jgi:hypothetical protein